ncbi:phage tail protein [Allosphingosinicella sp.]|jgi:microcystin-dependent protein|uniref:phage tail protein n=1 Tax=Allosphingosinicella sp. TaxID=2823234 RepID=UPI002F1B3648
MSEPFLSEIKLVSFNFPPMGWALCNGQLLPINQNQALFSLLGTTYGGNGQTNFALPNLRGRAPIHFSNAHSLGEAAGSTSVTVNIQQLPQHIHLLQASTTPVAATTANSIPGAPGTNKFLAPSIASIQGGQTSPVNLYGTPAALGAMSPNCVTSVGGSQPHNNMMPYLTLNFIIALQGIFPSRN